MSINNACEKWIETGYDLFANEGPAGIQVERLARILKLNKSGFYHYFKDMENFHKQLVKHHYQLYDLFLDDLVRCENMDPDCINVTVKHRATIMVQIQMVRNKCNPLFDKAHIELDEKISRTILPLWINFTDIHNNPGVAYQYFGLVRDMFYSRIEMGNLNYDYLHSMSVESKELVKGLLEEKFSVSVKALVKDENLNGVV